MSENPNQGNEIINVKDGKEGGRLSIDFDAFEKAMKEGKIDAANSVRLIDSVSKNIDSINDMLAGNQQEKGVLSSLGKFLKGGEDAEIDAIMNELAKKSNDMILSYMKNEGLADAQLIQGLNDLSNLPNQPEFAKLFAKNSQETNNSNLVVQTIEDGFAGKIVKRASENRDRAVEEASGI